VTYRVVGGCTLRVYYYLFTEIRKKPSFRDRIRNLGGSGTDLDLGRPNGGGRGTEGLSGKSSDSELSSSLTNKLASRANGEPAQASPTAR
jgi:hypothetical protein